MKTTVFSFTTLLLAFGFNGVAQIVPPVQPDVPITGTVINTGLSVAPAIEHYAVVYDDGYGNYTVNWLDDAGGIVDTHTGNGDDPDVAYYSNADVVFTTYTNGGDVYIDNHFLTTLSPTVNYNLGTTKFVSSGVYPNVDCNSDGNGVLCWEKSGNIYACTFTPGLTLGPVTLIASGSTTPDIVLMDNNNEVVITYTTFSGDLYIEKYEYPDLTMGVASLISQWNYNGSPYGFSVPRVAADRNANYGSLDNFTVVAQYLDPSVTRYIMGFFNMSGTMNVVPVNNGVENCANHNPVVTYERKEVHVAWASEAGSGCATVPGGLGDNVLMSEFKFDGTNLAPGVFYELNSWSNGFVEAHPSITAEYDGDYSINGGNYHEAVLYNDIGDLFWKARNTGTPPLFKESVEAEVVQVESIFKLLENPVQHSIYIGADKVKDARFTLYDNQGKQVKVNTVINSGDYYQIDIKHLAKGIYYLDCYSGDTTERFKIVH